VGLKAQIRSGVAALCIASLAAPAGFAEGRAPAPSAAGPLAVSVAQSADFSRIEFRWSGGAAFTSRRDGRSLILQFSRYATPDMSRLRVDPPRWLKTAEDHKAGGRLEIALTLADGADAKVGQADGAIFVNLFADKSPQAAVAPPPGPTPADPAAPPARADAVPASGVVKMTSQAAGGHILLRFPWKAPVGAAVFRRGAAVWVVFDAAAKLDLSAAPHGFQQLSGVQAVQGKDFTAARIASPADVAVTAIGEGAAWTVDLGPAVSRTLDAVVVTRDEASSAAGLAATVAGATRVVWLDDPVVGDRIAAVTALAPSKGLPSRREYVDLALLPSAQGLGVEPIADDVAVVAEGDIVTIGRPKGLALSPKTERPQLADMGPGLPQPTTRPGLIDFDNWSRTGSGGFLPRYDALQSAVAAEMDKGKDAGVAARMGLARFLVGSELSYEAIGVLNMIAKDQQSMLGDAELRGLRGAARVMAGRYKEAQADLSTPMLTDDPASALWRGYVAAKLGQWADARQQFITGQPVLYQFSPKWRARFARADAEAATALGQYPVADVAIEDALRGVDDPLEQLATRLVQARLFEAEGQKLRALGVYDVIAHVDQASLSAPALLHATQIRLDLGQISPVQAANVYDGLRYRWRGDATELDTIRALGEIYLDLGRYREALEVLRSAGQRLPDLPQAIQVQADLSGAFRSLFLDGRADGLQPVQALALFYDFKDLTPIGADGDLMVRKLARRLVDVDLLTQAAELLKYQADNRLDGVPRAEVSTDLAMIELMNRRPEQALEAINSSRTTLLPAALNLQRRAIESRAWLQVGQYDHALEIIEADNTPDAGLIRAEVAWKKHDWAGSGAMFEKLLGDRWKVQGPLTADDEAKLLRAGVAFSLIGDDASLARLRGRYQGFLAQARSPDALKVALSGVSSVQLTSTDFTRAAAENDSFVGWVQAMKDRFRQRPAPVTAAKSAQTAAAGAPSRG
jgi:tetratricopeptide (TPR) repeat protein